MEEVEIKVLQEERSTPFSEDALQAAWQSFKAERLETGASDTERVILDRTLKKTDEQVITIYLESKLEISILEKCEQDLIQFLKGKLDNSLIQIQKEVTEIKTTKNLYTSRDKFEYMAKQNPTLTELKEKLGLDFDY